MLILSSHLLMALGGIFIKSLAGDLSSGAVTGWVLLLSPLFFIVYALWKHELGPRTLKALEWRIVWIRAALVSLATFLSFYAYQRLPLAEAFSLSFLTPLFITLLAFIFLKEQIGWYRRSAVLAGLVGVFIMLRPGFRETDPAQVLAQFAMIGSAFLIACNNAILRRQLVKNRHQANIAANTLGVALASVVLALPAFGYPLVTATVTPNLFSGLLLISVVISLSVICNSEAHFRAEASYLAPFHYTQLIWAALAGLIFWGEWPDLYSWLGAMLIVGSGIFTIWREKVRHVAMIQY